MHVMDILLNQVVYQLFPKHGFTYSMIRMFKFNFAFKRIINRQTKPVQKNAGICNLGCTNIDLFLTDISINDFYKI